MGRPLTALGVSTPHHLEEEPVKEVETEVNGVKTTLVLDDEDAKNLDEQGYQRKRAEGDDEPSTKARKTTANK